MASDHDLAPRVGAKDSAAQDVRDSAWNSMQINEEEINALLAEANEATEAAKAPAYTPASAATSFPENQGSPDRIARDAGAAPIAPLPDFSNADPNVKRLLRLRVPVIVQLAHRRLPIAKIRNYSSGSIIEFAKSVDAPMELLIRNEQIGGGDAVRVNEKFGIHIKSIKSRTQRIKSLGE
ncbi:MAG: FliM/FliN family flagellar motor switch protein [Phycisphaerae bacterium]